jgi:hypothetical protein
MLYFRLGRPTENGLVRLSQAGRLLQDIPFSTGDSLRHVVWLEGLAAGQAYDYEVLVDGAALAYLDDSAPWGPAQFKTPPFSFPFTVAAIGDSGFGERVTRELGAKLAGHQPDMFLHLGDVVYRMEEWNNDPWLNWKYKYFDPFRPLLQTMPHYPTFGNHELDGPAFLDDIPSYYWVFPPLNESDQHLGSRMWYSFDVNNIQFLSLNSQLFYSYADLRQTQEDWLDQKLARTDVLYTVVFCHIPPFTSSAPHQWDGVYVAEQWGPKFAAANVPLVLNGHAHVYERTSHLGVNYVTAGGGSTVIYGEGQRLEQTKIMWSLTSYPILEFSEESISLRAYDMQDQVLDQVRFAVNR